VTCFHCAIAAKLELMAIYAPNEDERDALTCMAIEQRERCNETPEEP
jgi:hypothetical protein